MKHISKLLVLLVSTVCLLSSITDAQAMTVEINKSPDLELEVADNTLKNLTDNLTPGEARSTELEFVNNTNKYSAITLAATSKESKEYNLLKKTNLCIKANNEIVFDGSFCALFEAGTLKVGELNPGNSLSLYAEVQVDSSADNRYTFDNNMVVWNFRAAEDESGNKLPQTGHTINLIIGVACFLGSLCMFQLKTKGESNV